MTTAHDDTILWLWRSGKRAEQIARLVNLPETRVLHDVDRLLRANSPTPLRKKQKPQRKLRAGFFRHG